MTQQNNRRYQPEKQPPDKKKGDRILNYLITLVVILIIVVAAFIFTDGSKTKVANEAPKEPVKEQTKDKDKAAEKDTKEADSEEEDNPEAGDVTMDLTITSIEDLKKSDSAQVETINDGIVEESIVDPNWKPYKTQQEDTGAGHVSSYDKGSTDWQEKIAAIATITGLPEDDMTIWFIKNNGGTDRSIGTISSKDQTEKYRVSLKWVDQQGWQAEKVEVLKQIEGAY